MTDATLDAYAPPKVRSLGSVDEMTEQSNKIGSAVDQYTPATGGEVVGTVIPLP